MAVADYLRECSELASAMYIKYVKQLEEDEAAEEALKKEAEDRYSFRCHVTNLRDIWTCVACKTLVCRCRQPQDGCITGLMAFRPRRKLAAARAAAHQTESVARAHNSKEPAGGALLDMQPQYHQQLVQQGLQANDYDIWATGMHPPEHHTCLNPYFHASNLCVSPLRCLH